MFFAIIPLLVLIVGLLIWVLASNPLVKEVGKWMFICGLFVTLWVSARVTVHLG